MPTNRHMADGDGIGPGAAQTTAVPRGWVQLGLVVAAIAVVVWSWDGSHRYALSLLDGLGDGGGGVWMGGDWDSLTTQLSPEQRFLLEGDVTRTNRQERQRAIWERHPENRVYLGNYLTALAAAGSNTVSFEFYRGELAAARRIDPENARMDYLEAYRLLKQAAEIRSEKSRTEEGGKAKTVYSLEVRDREQLDEAMRILREGLGMPHWRRYSVDMLKEQLAILGPPRRFVDLVRRTAIAAGTLLPDLAQVKTLAHASRLYAELLMAEGKSAEAVPFLEAWEPLTRQLTEDSFTLIDVLVAGAMAADAQNYIPPLYHRLGREAEAERAAARAATIAKPVRDWREQRERVRSQDAQTAEEQRAQAQFEERAGLLASMLMPALGQWPDGDAYDAGRMLEYTVFTELLIGVILVSQLAVIVVSLLLALRWRVFGELGVAGPARRMPGFGTMIWIVGCGVVLPLILFYVVTRYFPGSGHAYSLQVGRPKLMAEFGLITFALGTLPILLTLAWVRRFCRSAGIDVARWQARYLFWLLACLGVVLLVFAWCLPAARDGAGLNLAYGGLGCLAVAVGASVLLGFAQGLAGQRQHGPFYSVAFRALVPALALSLVVLGVVSRPLLLHSEAEYIARDSLMQDQDRVGFTRQENELVEELRTEMLGSFVALK